MLDDSTRGCQACVQTLGKQLSFPYWPRWRKRGFPRRLNGTLEPVFPRESVRAARLFWELLSCGANSQVWAKIVPSSRSGNSRSTKAELGRDSARVISGSTKNSLVERILFIRLRSPHPVLARMSTLRIVPQDSNGKRD